MKYFITAPGRNDLYWRPNSQGYTIHLDEAGLYEEHHARVIENLGRGDRIWPFDMAKEMELLALEKRYADGIQRIRQMLKER